MKKRYKRKNTGWMRRSSRIYLNDVNTSKSEHLKQFLIKYQNTVNYSIIKFWSNKNLSENLAGKKFTNNIKKRFDVTARLSQCAAKQAKEIVRSQVKRNLKRMPRFTSHTASLDSRFVSIEPFEGSFDMCMKFSSGVPNLVIPFNLTKHTNKFLDNGWELSNSIRLGYDNKGLFADLLFEKEKPLLKQEGKVIGIDKGYNCMISCSDGCEIGRELKPLIKTGGKRRKSYHHFIETEENRYLKQFNLNGIKTIVCENLKYVKHNKRGKFSRNMNRLLSFWHYAKVGKRLEQLCEEQGVRIEYKDPSYTSQRCSVCDNIDKRNRKGEKFHCLKCGHTDNADHNASKNLEFLGLAGEYSLRSLKSGIKAGDNTCL